MFGNSKNNPIFAHCNGDSVKSKTTGFEGIITARSENLYGCNRYYLTPKIDKDNKLPDGYWFDEDDLQVVVEQVLKKNKSNTGGFPNRDK